MYIQCTCIYIVHMYVYVCSVVGVDVLIMCMFSLIKWSLFSDYLQWVYT